MKHLFHDKPKIKFLIIGFLIVLAGAGITIAAFHTSDSTKASNETGLKYTEILSKPTAIIPNQNTVSQKPDKSVTNKVTAAPAATPTIKPYIMVDDTEYNYDLYSLDFIDDKNGWVVQWNYNDPEVHNTTSLIHTDDGGVHWDSYASQDCLLQEVSFVNSEIGWALALEGHPELSDGNPVIYQILWTVDGGKNWKLQMTCEAVYGESCDIAANSKSSASVIIGGMIYRTEDSGKNWNKIESPVKDFSAEHIFYVDELNGWFSGVVKFTVYVFHTTDGGETWKQQFSKDCGTDWNEIIDISFADKKNGWFQICNYGIFYSELYHTTDGGNNWEVVREGAGIRPYSQEIEAVTPESLWIPLHGGAGPIEGGLSYSKDGGKSFTFIGMESGFVNSNGIEFVTPSIGWAIMNGFQEKYLMKTVDGGVIWDKVMFAYN